MPGSAAKVVITERQQDVLREFVNGRTTPVAIAPTGDHRLAGLRRRG